MNSFKFEGKGFAFFKIHFINVILTILSLTLLYPWAKVREIKYLCQNTYLAGNHFTFTGTLRDFFKGYIRTFILVFLVFLLCFAGGALTATLQGSILSPVINTTTVLFCTLILYYFSPIILHGSLNYRLDNTSWGDIRPSYIGKLSELVPMYFSGTILTMLTLGIYTAWFQVKINKYLLQHFRFGSLRFDFSGDSKKLFILLLKGTLLCMITFGIYGIWLFKQLYEYYVENIVVKKDDQEFKLNSNANTLEVFEMTVGNILLVCLTLGIGASWAYMRYYRFVIDHCVIPADFNFNSIYEAQEPEREEATIQNWLDKWNPTFIA